MPSNIVKTKRDERLWQEAKEAAAREGHAEDWAYINGVYQHMRKHSGSKSVAKGIAVPVRGGRNMALTRTVYDYLRENYPADVLDWVKDEAWEKRRVPLSDIHMARRPGGRNMVKVAGISRAIAEGKPMEPVVLVETGDGYKIADGYHRTLAFKHAGKKSIEAYVAVGEHDNGPWDRDMHDAKLNKSLLSNRPLRPYVPRFMSKDLDGRMVLDDSYHVPNYYAIERMCKAIVLTDEDDLLEKLASLEHDQWMDFAMRISPEIEPAHAEAWKKLFVPYDELPENEKEKDRIFARRALDILRSENALNKSLGTNEKRTDPSKVNPELVKAYRRAYRAFASNKSEEPDTPRWSKRADGPKGRIWRASDGWGEWYFLLQPIEKGAYGLPGFKSVCIATRMADVMAYNFKPPFSDFTKAQGITRNNFMQKVGFGDSKWDTLMRRFVSDAVTKGIAVPLSPQMTRDNEATLVLFPLSVDRIAKSNGKHHVRSHVRVRNGKRQTVQEHEAKNPTRKKRADFTDMYDAEDKIRNSPTESGYVFDDRGNLLWEDHQDGYDSMDITEPYDLGLLKGNIFTHNHPNELSFSVQDAEALLRSEMKEMRAVSERFDYVIRPPKNFSYSNDDIQRFFEDFNEESEKVGKELKSAIEDERLTAQEAHLQFMNDVWMRMADRTGIYYERKERDEVRKSHQKIHSKADTEGQKREIHHTGNRGFTGFRSGGAECQERQERKTRTTIESRQSLSKGFGDSRTPSFPEANFRGQRPDDWLLTWGADMGDIAPTMAQDAYNLYRRVMGAESSNDVSVKPLDANADGSTYAVSDGKHSLRVYVPSHGPARLMKAMATLTPTPNSVWAVLHHAGYRVEPKDGEATIDGCHIRVRENQVEFSGKGAAKWMRFVALRLSEMQTSEDWIDGHMTLGKPGQTVKPW